MAKTDTKSNFRKGGNSVYLTRFHCRRPSFKVLVFAVLTIRGPEPAKLGRFITTADNYVVFIVSSGLTLSATFRYATTLLNV